jgi:hypothetical protein
MTTNVTIVPYIEENEPLPKTAVEAMPDLTPKEELDMRVRTIKLVADLNGTPLEPTKEQQEQAVTLAKQMMDDPTMRPDYAAYPNETLAYLAGMVAQMNYSLVNDLADYKNYVVTKLVYEIEHAKDAKARLTALTKLGEVDGVDAFKKRTEVTVKVQPIEEVEKELLGILQGIRGKVVDIDPKDVKTIKK